MAANKSQQAAFLAVMQQMAAALGIDLPDAPTATGKAAEPVAYFTAEEIEAGKGYPCEHPTKPCKRRLRGPNRTRAHRGRNGHKPQF